MSTNATFLVATLTMFLLGLYFYVTAAGSYVVSPMEAFAVGGKKQVSEETMKLFTERRCPNVLYQKGSKFYLYNNRLATIPGVNPVIFENLEDYNEFLEWQRSQGIRCPVLYLQQSFDAQGKTVFTMRPSVLEPQGGLNPSAASPVGIASQDQPMLESQLSPGSGTQPPNPTKLVDAGRNDPPYNQGSYPAYDATSYYVGTTTPLDQMNAQQEGQPISPDPMDPNWGGERYTQSLIDRGYYRDNEVAIRIA